MSFKTPLLCDRRIYDKRGKWKSPNNDIEEIIYYFVKEPLTLTNSYVNGQEQLTEQLTITIFGGKPIIAKDKITLEDGTIYEVQSFVINYIDSNILVKDFLKPRIESMDLILM